MEKNEVASSSRPENKGKFVIHYHYFKNIENWDNIFDRNHFFLKRLLYNEVHSNLDITNLDVVNFAK